MAKQSTIAKLPPEAPANKSNSVRVVTKQKETSAPNVDKEKLKKLINKSGRSARPVDEKILRKFTLRVDENIMLRVERAGRERDIVVTNLQWITEAVLEKLKKEGF